MYFSTNPIFISEFFFFLFLPSLHAYSRNSWNSDQLLESEENLALVSPCTRSQAVLGSLSTLVAIILWHLSPLSINFSLINSLLVISLLLLRAWETCRCSLSWLFGASGNMRLNKAMFPKKPSNHFYPTAPVLCWVKVRTLGSCYLVCIRLRAPVCEFFNFPMATSRLVVYMKMQGIGLFLGYDAT